MRKTIRELFQRRSVQIGYFVAGILFIPLSRFFVPFWIRFPVLALWAVGLAMLLPQLLGKSDKQA
ncbi:hypothetical protein [Desulfobaculum bizertense]|uniref:hypothetical protein n=1 Tax=Desulfobaculum bizertense TaxID=376490 RepID=UPI000999148A|nr:hypothetical protein [Desulfobaculum bizertense]UIJ36773.1 hypothetical protein LWC08_08470 [Desulfobaculum bizertense]